ncbi:MAG: D-alanine--D-alanine ligase A, partial [bacterium]
MQKIKVAVIYGGKSSEHEVSLKSAFGVIKAMSSDKYDILPIGITKEGRWVTGELGELMADGQSMRLGEEEFLLYPDGRNNKGLKIDVVFP